MRRLLAVVVSALLIVIPAGDMPREATMADVADLPGRLVPVWAAPTGDSDPLPWDSGGPFAVRDDVVVLPGGQGQALQLHDPRTGAVREWMSAEPGHEVSTVGFSHGVLVVDHEHASSDVRQLIGYDPRTLRPVWRTAVHVSRGTTDQTMLSWSVQITPAAIVVVANGQRDVTVIDPRTGREVWRTPLPRTCDLDVAAWAVVVILQACEDKRVRLRAFDLGTGRPAWQDEIRVKDESIPQRVTMAADGRVLLEAGDIYRTYMPDGRRLTETTDSALNYGVSGPVLIQLLLDERKGGETRRLRGIDAGDGKTLWTRPNVPIAGMDGHHTLLQAQGLLIGETSWNHKLSRWPLPYFVTFLHQWNGSYRALPTPYSEFPSTLIGAAGGLVFIHHEFPDGGRVVAYRPEAAPFSGPYELGGTSPDAWPDACTLLPASDLAMLDDGHHAFPRKRGFGDVTFPRPVSCDLVPPRDGGQAVTVTIDWVARSEEEATVLAENHLFNVLQSWPLRPFRPGIHQIPGPSLEPILDSALIQVGPVIAHLTVYDSPKNLRKVAPVVARNLRRHLGE